MKQIRGSNREVVTGRVSGTATPPLKGAVVMIRKGLIALVAVAVLASIPALAGDYGKCKASTQECLDHMATKIQNSGFVGIEYDQNEETGSLTIIRVVPDSPAEAAGIEPGDELYALEGIKICETNKEALAKAKKDWSPGQSVNYTIKRNGTDKEITLTLAPMPADVMAKWIGQHMLEHAAVEIAENK